MNNLLKLAGLLLLFIIPIERASTQEVDKIRVADLRGQTIKYIVEAANANNDLINIIIIWGGNQRLVNSIIKGLKLYRKENPDMDFGVVIGPGLRSARDGAKINLIPKGSSGQTITLKIDNDDAQLAKDRVYEVSARRFSGSNRTRDSKQFISLRDSWSVKRYATECWLTGVFRDGAVMNIVVDDEGDYIQLRLARSDWKKMRRELDAFIDFNGPVAPALAASWTVLESGDRSISSRNTIYRLPSPLVRQLKKADRMQLNFEGWRTNWYSLTGSSEALVRLNKCSKSVIQ